MAPAVFDADDDGYGVIRDGGELAPGDEQEARRGAANCPEDAISLEE
jgi:ferredoxin